MTTLQFADIADEFMARVNRMVWCSMATVDGAGRPRSRIIHPIWEGQTAWITTDRASFKARHLARNPYVSLAYVSEPFTPAYAECRAEWVDDPDAQRHVWELCRQTPEPAGFDPAGIYAPVGSSPEEAARLGRIAFGVLRLTPCRITLTQWPEPQRIWTASADGGAEGAE